MIETALLALGLLSLPLLLLGALVVYARRWEPVARGHDWNCPDRCRQRLGRLCDTGFHDCWCGAE